MRIETPRIVQSRRRPVYLWFIAAAVLAAAVFFGKQAVLEYRQQIIADHSDLQLRYADQLKKMEALESERSSLRRRVAALERDTQIDQEATRQVKAELKQKQTQWQEKENELDFLRQIASGKGKSDALYIQGFRLGNGASTGGYTFKFTVSQMLQKEGYAEGWLYLQVIGGTGEAPELLSLKDIAADKLDRIKIRFRHFQDIEGVIQLPEGFEPKSIQIKVEPISKRLSPLKKKFNWLIVG